MEKMEEGMNGVGGKFDSLQQNIEQFIETMRQIGIMVSDFQPGSQDTLNEKMYVSNSHSFYKIGLTIVDMKSRAAGKKIYHFIGGKRDFKLPNV